MDDSNCCSPTDESAHGPRLISRGPIGNVVLCGCGHLHLNLQYLTLRFEPQAFQELAALLLRAQHRLDADARLRGADDCPGEGPCSPIH